MALNKDMLDLIATVHKPVIFYLPERLFPNLPPDVIKGFEAISLLNTLFLIDEKGTPGPIDGSIKYVTLLGKPKILKSNIFQLLEMKSNLNKDTFLYLLNDYNKEVSTWVSATEVIKNDALHETVNYAKTLQSYLDLQYQCLRDHQLELNSKFGEWKSDVEFERISKVFKKSSSINSKSNVSLKASVEDKRKTTIRLNKSKSLISDEEADKYLLNTIFNVYI
ncbi:MAG: hypothetical protein GYB35_12510 [Algicola sp.]|nr:hypothetical protein [Algicola sp.]